MLIIVIQKARLETLIDQCVWNITVGFVAVVVVLAFGIGLGFMAWMMPHLASTD